MPTSGAVSVGHRGVSGSPRPVVRASWANPMRPRTISGMAKLDHLLRAGAGGLLAWSGHLKPTSVRMAQSGQIGVSQVTQVMRVGLRWRVHFSSPGPSTGGKATQPAVGRLRNHGRHSRSPCPMAALRRHRVLPAGGAAVPALGGVQEGRPRRRPVDVRRRRARLAGLLGQAGARPARLVRGVAHHPGVGPALRQVVCRRQAERRLQLRRPSRRGGQGRQGRLPLGGRAGRHPHDHLRRPADRGGPVRRRPAVARRHQGRPGGDLHADDPGAAGGHAGVRPPGRPALRRVRRLLVGGAAGPDQRRRGQGADHRRRRLAAGQRHPAQGQRRRRRGRDAVDRPCRGRAPDREAGGLGRRPRPLVPRPHGRRVRRRRRRAARAGRLRGPPLPPLHLGDHGQAQGHHAHDRGLPDPGRLHPQVRVRPACRHRRLLVRGRHRLGDRPQLHRLRAAGQRGHVGDVRGQPRLPAEGPVVVDHRALQGQHPLHRARRPSARS